MKFDESHQYFLLMMIIPLELQFLLVTIHHKTYREPCCWLIIVAVLASSGSSMVGAGLAGAGVGGLAGAGAGGLASSFGSR